MTNDILPVSDESLKEMPIIELETLTKIVESIDNFYTNQNNIRIIPNSNVFNETYANFSYAGLCKELIRLISQYQKDQNILFTLPMIYLVATELIKKNIENL